MKQYYILLVVIILISCNSASQFDPPGEKYFVKFYGEDGNHEGVDFIANDDGTYILLGNVKMPGLKQQIYLVKVDAQGMVIGEPKSFGEDVDHFAKDIERTPDGNIIVAGESQTEIGNRDVYLLIVDNNLNLIGEKTISGILQTTGGVESDEEVNSISVISDGYIVSGSTTAVETNNIKDTKDALHLRFTFSLDLILEENLGNPIFSYTTGYGDSEDVLVKVIEVENSSLFYGFGYTNSAEAAGISNSNHKYWAFGLNNTGGKKDFDDVFGSAASDEYRLSGVIKSPAESGEGYVLSGVKSNGSGESQSYLLKLKKELEQGQNNVLSEGSPTELGVNVNSETSMTTLSTGGYLLLSNSMMPSNDNMNISLIRVSNTFMTEGRESIYFGGVGDDFAGSVTELPDGKIAVIGTMTLGGVAGQTKMAFMKLNKDGKLIE